MKKDQDGVRGERRKKEGTGEEDKKELKRKERWRKRQSTTEKCSVNIFSQLHLRVNSSRRKNKLMTGLKVGLCPEAGLTLPVLSCFDLSVFQGKLNTRVSVWILLQLVIHLC